MKSPQSISLSVEEAEALCQRIKSNNLSEKEIELIIGVIDSHAWMKGQLIEGKLTASRLRKLFGITTERAPDYASKQLLRGKETAGKEKTVKGHGRLPVEAYTMAEDSDVLHPTLKPGEPCPAVACDGKLYEMKSPVVLRIEGNPLASAKRYHLQSLRCNRCEEVFTAPLPEGVHPTEKYDVAFKSLLLVQKYFTAVPFYRQETLQTFLGVPMPASTQWDVIKNTVPVLKAVYEALFQVAANGEGFYVDDTPAKILAQMAANKKATTKKEKKGCYTTGILSVKEAIKVYLFVTDTQTSGRSFNRLWHCRDPDLPIPFLMCDGSTANIPPQVEEHLYVLCHCLAHGRRKFYDLQGCYETLSETVLDFIGKIYTHDAHTKKENLSAEARLAYHQAHSAPVMADLKNYLEAYRLHHLAEPNGSAGKAIRYLLERWETFTRFMTNPGLPLDSNIIEQALKIPIRTRKNALFHKTAFGAEVAGYAQSLIFTAAQNKVNPYDYLKTLLTHQNEVMDHPSAWLPWNYRERLTPKELATLCQESVH